jgi:hypothetical protein
LNKKENRGNKLDQEYRHVIVRDEEHADEPASDAG